MKKFGTFGGVFTPSILTILGVIMYLRLGWVVGHAGLIGAILIIIVAHVISVSTGLSVSSISTDKKVGAGGIYYILSRSMGIPIGGAIGIALYVGTALSIALYLVGFAESFNLAWGLSTEIQGLRITGGIALIVLTTIALISTSAAIKTQYIILGLIVISLIAIFSGTSEFIPETINNFPSKSKDAISIGVIFAIFFPAVTGFTAGIAMSGDLKDPKKAIPIGTLAAVAVGFVVYVCLAIYLAYNVDANTLQNDNNILMRIALLPQFKLVLMGVWGATLSSALGGILGGPRILQAMSVDKITPRVFGKGRGKSNEPVNALFLVFVIAFAGVMIGELDVIAGIVSMFYLAAYGFINLSFFLESWANPDFQPTFKVKRWIGLLGFIACFGVMFQIEPLYMFAAIAIILGIYFWLKRKQIMLSSGDVWQSVWENIVAKGLKKLEQKEKNNTNWNPNIILFSGDTSDRPHLLELSKTVSGRTGIVTNFNMIEKSNNTNLQSKTEQIIEDNILVKMGIFGRRIEVDDIFSGITNVATTYGFSGIDPNTIMMGWPKSIKREKEYFEMTQKLIRLDYNLLYFDYDKQTKFGNKNTIDIWWRETDNNNAEMMLNIVRMINQAPEWNNCVTRILFVNHNNVDSSLVKSKIQRLVEDLRISAEIKVINNGVEQKSFYEIIKNQSINTDLVLLGIPDVAVEKQAEFVMKTNYLFETIGSTLMVKASNNFNEIELNFADSEEIKTEKNIQLKALPISEIDELTDLVHQYDEHLSVSSKLVVEPALTTISSFYYQLINGVKQEFEKTKKRLLDNNTMDESIVDSQDFLQSIITLSEQFTAQRLSSLEETFSIGIQSIVEDRKRFIDKASVKVKINNKGKNQSVKWKSIINHFDETKIRLNIQFSFYEFGVQNFVLLNKLSEQVAIQIENFLEKKAINSNAGDLIWELDNKMEYLFEELTRMSSNFVSKFLNSINNYERNLCISLIKEIESGKKNNTKTLNKKVIAHNESNVKGFAADWYRNQKLAHKQAEANLEMAIQGLSLFKINEQVKNQINTQVFEQEIEKTLVLSALVEKVQKSIASNTPINLSVIESDTINSQVSDASISSIIENEEDKILAISGNSNLVTDLISEESYNNLIKVQNEDVEIITLNLHQVQDYIVQSKYLAPFQENRNKSEHQFNENSEKLFYAASLIKHLIDENQSGETHSDYQDVLEDAKKRIDNCAQNLDRIQSTFEQDLDSNLHNTLSDLNIRSVIESAELYESQVYKVKSKSKLATWASKKKDSFRKSFALFSDFVVQRKRDIDTLKFDEKHIKYLNSIEQTNNFLIALSVNVEVEDKLPFYYKKLFSGSHLGDASTREKSMVIAQQAIARIDEGVEGAIMVLGEASSGKTFFTEQIANSIHQGKKYYINPPVKQRYEINDLHKSFQKVFNQTGTTESILSKVEPHTIFVFNDIEEWWINSEQGSSVLNYLSKIIEQFGSRHYFILNANIYSFDVIRKTSTLEKDLLATIIMSPANSEDLKKIILNRHRTAGLDLYYHNELVGNNSKTDKLMSSIHSVTEGSIGLALNLWLSSINKAENHGFEIEKPKTIKFPPIIDPNWKLILYQFILHGKLSLGHLQMMFGKDHQWIMDALLEMEKSGIITSHASRLFKIDKNAKHYVENWLKESKILND